MRAIIFDMDGTLFQTDTILERSLQDTFEHLRTMKVWNQETPIRKYRDMMGVPLPVVWEALLPEHSNKCRQRANDLFHQRLIENIKIGKGALYPHTKEIFRFLKKNGFHIFVASNGQTEYLDAIIQYYDLHHWIKETFSIQQIQTQNKSDLVRAIIQKYDIDSGAVVGDRLSDINAAKENNLVSIGCNFDFAQEEELSQADVVIDHLSELKEVLSLT
ncbi:MAG: HAD family hydrolase [Bacillus sp. (in: firmicutes)]